MRAARELAELIAALPEGLHATLTDAASRTGQRRLGYVIEHREGLPASQARSMAWRLAEGARQRATGEPQYGEDRMLLRLLREVLFHRDSERRHLAGLVIASSPFRGPVAEEMINLLGETDIPEWVRGRAATAIRYLAVEEHRLRCCTGCRARTPTWPPRSRRPSGTSRARRCPTRRCVPHLDRTGHRSNAPGCTPSA